MAPQVSVTSVFVGSQSLIWCTKFDEANVEIILVGIFSSIQFAKSKTKF